VAVSLALAGLVLAAAFVGLTVQGNAIAREIAAYKSDAAAEQAQYQAFTTRIAGQKTTAYVQEKARDYGYIAPNEAIIALQRDGQASDALARTVREGPSRIERWIAFFFGAR
jgi:cell division protein FtsB